MNPACLQDICCNIALLLSNIIFVELDLKTNMHSAPLSLFLPNLQCMFKFLLNGICSTMRWFPTVSAIKHFFGAVFFTRNEIFLQLRNESVNDDNSCKLEKDGLSVHIVTFPCTLNFDFFCMLTHKSICLPQL